MHILGDGNIIVIFKKLTISLSLNEWKKFGLNYHEKCSQQSPPISHFVFKLEISQQIFNRYSFVNFHVTLLSFIFNSGNIILMLILLLYIWNTVLFGHFFPGAPLFTAMSMYGLLLIYKKLICMHRNGIIKVHIIKDLVFRHFRICVNNFRNKRNNNLQIFRNMALYTIK